MKETVKGLQKWQKKVKKELNKENKEAIQDYIQTLGWTQIHKEHITETDRTTQMQIRVIQAQMQGEQE